MSTLLEQAFDRARSLSPDVQDDLARLLLEFADDTPYQLSAEEQRSLETTLAEADRREFASDEEIAEIWRKHAP